MRKKSSNFLTSHWTSSSDGLRWQYTSSSPENALVSDDMDTLGDFVLDSTHVKNHAGIPEPYSQTPAKKSHPQYMAWLSNRQALRRSTNSNRHAAESSRELSPSAVHPYGRPGRKQDRAHARHKIYEGSQYSSNLDERASCSSESLSSVPGSPHWTGPQHLPDPDYGRYYEDGSSNVAPGPGTHRAHPFPSSDVAPHRGNSAPHLGLASPAPLEMRPRARTANDSDSAKDTTNALSVYLNSAQLIQQLNLQGSGSQTEASEGQDSDHHTRNDTANWHEARPAPSSSSGDSARQTADQMESNKDSSTWNQNDSSGTTTDAASRSKISTSRTDAFGGSASIMDSPKQISKDPHSYPPSSASIMLQSLSSEYPSGSASPAGDSSKSLVSSSHSTDLRNAYQALTRSLQMDSFDWAQSPNSNGSFSQHDGTYDSYSRSRTHDLTMSWLQRGLIRSSSAGRRNTDAPSEDDSDLAAEAMMESNDFSSLYQRSSWGTSEGEAPLDVFEVGDRVGPGLRHDGELIRVAETSEGFAEQDPEYFDKQLEVDHLLGYGSYAVVYLVHDVPESDRAPTSVRANETPTESRTPGARSGELAGKTPVADAGGHVQPSSSASRDHPRQFALKCLSKQNLSSEMLDLQRIEATIHQSIPKHPNIITLYCIYETSNWLFLVLEYCPGQDLYYWLEEADLAQAPLGSLPMKKDKHDNSSMQGTMSEESMKRLYSTPWLLARSSPNLLLSKQRLEFVGEMFFKMCEAVQFCHDRGISHRDIKPENFIVQDARDIRHSSGEGQIVTVKLTDFGLATVKDQCDDFNCGSKPYMAFECRHNLTKTYDPKQADIWSLGIVLLNLLFHRSPFKEPSVEHCASFSAFSYRPTFFLTEAFDGLTEEVARFLCDRVFCDVSQGRCRRISARDFGAWARQLPQLLGQRPQGLNREVKGAIPSATSPLHFSKAPGSNRMQDSAPHSPVFERPRTASWSQAQFEKLANHTAMSLLPDRRRSSASSANASKALLQRARTSEGDG